MVDLFRSKTGATVDAYWMRCHLVGPHEEHKNSETGAHWPNIVPVHTDRSTT